MATLYVWPSLNLIVPFPDASGAPLPASGALATVTPYIEECLRQGLLLTYDPTGNNGDPTDYLDDSVYVTDLVSLAGTFGGQVQPVSGYSALGDGGGGLYYWDPSSMTTQDYGTVVGNLAVGRWKRIYSGEVNAAWFGCKPDTGVNVITEFKYALSKVPDGGSIVFPRGTYILHRGNGSLDTDTITKSNITIRGEGKGTIFSGKPLSGTIANDPYNEFYTLFQATSKSGITIRDMSFEGSCAPIALYTCADVTIENIWDNGLLPNASKYLRDKGIFLYHSTDTRIINCDFNNVNFAVYGSGVAGSHTKRTLVTGCTFRQTATAGNFTAPFPVGVYPFFADDTVVTGCTFSDIYSSVEGGNEGTGLGYGVYEGDGHTIKGVTVSNCTFRYTGKGNRRACAIYVIACENASISNCAISGNSDSRILYGVYVGGYNPVSTVFLHRTVTGCTITLEDTTVGTGIYCYGLGTIAENIQQGSCVISSNSVEGGRWGISSIGLGGMELIINNNVCVGQLYHNIKIAGNIEYPKRNALIQGNKLLRAGINGIEFNEYVLSPRVLGNEILDGNQSNDTSVLGSAVIFASICYGCVIKDNLIGNTVRGAGKFSYGITNGTNIADRPVKDIIFGNNFLGIDEAKHYNLYHTSVPTAGIYDVHKGDFVLNTSLDSGETTGWFCVATYRPTLTANVVEGGTTVTVSSTSGLAVGDGVILCRDWNKFLGDGLGEATLRYHTAVEWHYSTIASITDATHFELASAVTGSGSTVQFDTGGCKVVRWKAAPVIA